MHHPPNLNDWQEPEDMERLPTQPHNWLSRWKQTILRYWSPEKIKAPKVDPSLPDLTGVERSAEVFRYSILSTEYWISPKGYLREWFRFNLRIASILIVPMLLVVPIITFALGQFSTWVSLLAATTANMILFPLSALLAVGLISALVYLGKSVVISRRMRRPPPGYYD